jgi:Mn2+/Fe2+ NRAMP family transporter
MFKGRFQDLQPKSFPAFPGFWAMLGPGLVWLALAQGSGELIFWPYLIAKYGLAFAFLILPSHLLQYPVNLAIGRYTLLTGEPIFKGFLRLSRWFGILLWIWMLVVFLWIGSWASAGGTALAELSGFPAAWSHPSRTLFWGYALMVVFLAALLLGKVVYALVERFMTVVALGTVVGLLWACTNPTVVKAAPAFFAALIVPATPIGELPIGAGWNAREWNFFLTAICFAGLGGFWTLFYSYWIKEKQYGMAHYVGRVTSPLRGEGEVVRLEGFRAEDTPENHERFRQWMRGLRGDSVVGLVGNLVTTTLTCLLAWAVLHPQGKVPERWDIAVVQADFFGAYWAPARAIFLFVAGFFLIDTWLGGVDAVARVHSHMVCELSAKARAQGVRFWYYAFVFFMAVATAVTMPIGDPGTIMAVSGVANLFGITVYSIALYLLAVHALRGVVPAWAIPGWWERLGLGISIAVYGALSLMYVRWVFWPMLSR